MRKTRMKQITKAIAVMMLVATIPSTISHADSIPITADKEVRTGTAGYYGWGYVKCDPYHYTSVQLIEHATDKIIAVSGRKYGYGKVKAYTPAVGGYASKDKLKARVYYGWK